MKKQPKKREGGQGMVEFALVLPIVLLLMYGMVEFGRLMFFYSAASTASREAVRYGSSTGDNGSGTPRYLDCDGIRNAALTIGKYANVIESAVAISYDASGTTMYCDDSDASKNAQKNDISFGDTINVVVTTEYLPIMPMVNMPTIPITSQSSRTIFKTAQVVKEGDTAGSSSSSADPPHAPNDGGVTTTSLYKNDDPFVGTGHCEGIVISIWPDTASHWNTNPGNNTPDFYELFVEGVSQGTVAFTDPYNWPVPDMVEGVNGTINYSVRALWTTSFTATSDKRYYALDCDYSSVTDETKLNVTVTTD